MFATVAGIDWRNRPALDALPDEDYLAVIREAWTPPRRAAPAHRSGQAWRERYPERAAVRDRILAEATPAPCDRCSSPDARLFVTDYASRRLSLALLTVRDCGPRRASGGGRMTAVRFDVRGLPIAQGSARPFVAGGRAYLATDANRLSSPLGAWRSAIATEARDAIGSCPPLTGPVRVDLRFRLPRPHSHYLPANGRRPEPVLRLDAPEYHAGKPDADKLTRAALDALTAVVFGDDAQVARLSVTKHYAGPSEGPGVAVAVQRLEMTR